MRHIKVTVNTFRKMEQAEERMMRAVMPKANAASPERLEGRFTNTLRTARTLTVPVLTFTMAEAAR